MEYGRKVRLLLRDGRSFEGTFIPSPNEDTIILKLNNGYNIGFQKDHIKDIIPLEEKVEVAKFPRRKPIYREGLKGVSIIVTGGTIMSRVDYRTGGVHMFLDPYELLYEIPELEDIAVINNILNPFSIASEDITPKEWVKIAEIVAKELNSGSDGVIIPHGTDTMHYTSAALSFMLRDLGKPVALVGAQRSSDRGSSDAFMNMICATIYATSNIAEVSVVMHGYISDEFCYAHRGTRVRKMHTERRDAFQSINDLPLAKIYPSGKIEIVNKNYRRRNDGEVLLDTKIYEKVALVKVYPGSDPEIIDFFVDKGYKGIVIEGTGFGHAPTETLHREKSWFPHIERAVEEGIIVCMTSQTIFGRTNSFVYSNARRLYNLGVIHCEDMLPEVAYVKLMWVLGHTENYEEVKNLMLTPLAGEIKPRSLEEEFINSGLKEKYY